MQCIPQDNSWHIYYWVEGSHKKTLQVHLLDVKVSSMPASHQVSGFKFMGIFLFFLF